MDDDILSIQWFPGHMAKARRMISENIRLVDIICEIIDARIPVSSRNPELPEITGNKPRIVIFNRIDLADNAVSKLWVRHFKDEGLPVIETDAKSGKGITGFSSAIRSVLKDKLEEYAKKGQAGRPLRAMVAGIPNVGKSTFINKLAKRKAAAASDRPGVTRGKQWITVDKGLELLDTPGLLWPKFDSPELGEHLAFTGAIKDTILDTETLAAHLMLRLYKDYPEFLIARYKLALSDNTPKFLENVASVGFELLEMAARKRGFLISGGEADLERMSAILLDEFRGGVIGRISLERPL